MVAIIGFRRRFGTILEQNVTRRWARLADRADAMDLAALEKLRDRARRLKRHADRLLHVADGRLTLPRIDSAVPRPLHADWVHRAPLWSGPVFPAGRASVENEMAIGPGATLFHDCRVSEISFRQIRNTGADDLAPFGARFDVFAFDGSFLSLVLDLPPQGVDGLKKRHILGLTLTVETEKPLEMFARLNIRHGPNTEQIVREFPMDATEMTVEFDLGYTELNERRIERAWIDLIFEGPQMNQIVLRDITMARRPRADL